MDLYPGLLARLPIYLLLTVSAASVVIGDYFAKKWSIDQKTIYLLLTFIGYIGGSFFYIPSLLKEGLVVTSIIWVVLSTIGFLFVGVMIFKESLSAIQMLGVGFGIISILLLSVTK